MCILLMEEPLVSSILKSYNMHLQLLLLKKTDKKNACKFFHRKCVMDGIE